MTGYARNLPNGSVEVLGCGAAQDLDRLESWLQSGPPSASVDKVEAVLVDVPEPPSFTIS